MSGESLTQIQRHFAEFACEYAALPLYHRIADGMSGDDLARLLLAAAPGQARPVLFLAALHDLVLRRPDVPAARWYPSVVGAEGVPSGDPWPDVRDTVRERQDELAATIASRTTQTNEVNRATYVAALLRLACADLRDRPVALVELGASAGLLLGVDRFRVEIGTAGIGPIDSPVHCRADAEGPNRLSSLTFPSVVSSIGVDRAPVSLGDVDEVRWLEACLWPDRPERLQRFRAAVDLLRSHPPQMVRDDLVDGCATAVSATLEHSPEAHVVVMTSWALTYVAPDRRTEVAATLASLASHGPAISWVSAEPVGCVPGIPDRGDPSGTTVLGLRRWREGRELPPSHLGSTHPHGTWVALSPESVG